MAGVSFCHKPFTVGLQFEYAQYAFEGIDMGISTLTPSIEFVFIQRPRLRLSAGFGIMFHIQHESIKSLNMVPLYMSMVLDLAKRNEGFVILPEISVVKLIGGSEDPSDKNLTGDLGLLAMFRREDGTSFIIRPGISINSEMKTPAISLAIMFVF